MSLLAEELTAEWNWIRVALLDLQREIRSGPFGPWTLLAGSLFLCLLVLGMALAISRPSCEGAPKVERASPGATARSRGGAFGQRLSSDAISRLLKESSPSPMPSFGAPGYPVEREPSDAVSLQHPAPRSPISRARRGSPILSREVPATHVALAKPVACEAVDEARPYEIGDAVWLWSNSANKWWDDGVVLAVLPEHVQVAFDGGSSKKVVPKAIVKDMLRRVAGGPPPTPHSAGCFPSPKTPAHGNFVDTPVAFATPASGNFGDAPEAFTALAQPLRKRNGSREEPSRDHIGDAPEAFKTPARGHFGDASEAVRTPARVHIGATPEAHKTGMDPHFVCGSPEVFKTPTSTYLGAPFEAAAQAPAAACAGRPQAAPCPTRRAPTSPRRYLPRFLQGENVVAALDAEPGTFVVHKSLVNVRTRGLAYRLSMDLHDLDPDESAAVPWGTLVRGEVVGDWLQVHF